MEVARERRRGGSVVLFATALACLLLAASDVRAQTGDQTTPSEADVRAAREHYRRAIRLYRQRAYESALAEFQKAHELAPSYRIDYNIAQVYQELGDHAGAMRALLRYLRKGHDELSDDKRARAEEQVVALRPKVTELLVRANVKGAEIAVDDEVVGHSPLSHGVWVNRGRRKVRATYPGWIPAGRVVMATGGETIPVELSLVDPKAAAHPSPAPPRPTPASDRQEPTGGSDAWIGWAATGALAAGAIASGVLHLAAKNDLEQERESLGTDPQDKRDALDDAHARASRYAIATDVFAISAAVAGGISLYITLKADEKEQVDVGVGPGSVQLRGSF